MTTAASPSWSRTFTIVGRDIKLAHSVFALPFALLAAFLVAPRNETTNTIDWRTLGIALVLIIVCMVAARTWAMLVNRLADRRIDAENQRTARRAFASGELSVTRGLAVLAGSAALFMLGCVLFGVLLDNWWPSILGAPVLIWIGFYSFTKRFTWLCHVFLGGALAASPIAAAIALGVHPLDAVRPEIAGGVPWLALMVLLWVAGFDVIYALQDLDYDKDVGLNSIPARFGWRGSAWISRGLHAGAIAALIMVNISDPQLGLLFTFAVAAVIGLLLWEHAILARRGARGIPMAFFTLNGAISCLLGVAGILDTLL